MKATWLIAAMIVLASSVSAQTYLEPDDAPFLGKPRIFGQDYGRQLKPEIGADVRVFDVIEGGLVPDFVVGLKTAKGGYRIFMVGEKRGGGLERCEASIDKDLAESIVIAWDKVVRQARKPIDKPMGGADAPFEHFGSRLQSRVVMGRVWGTTPGSNPAHLGRIASGLLQICSSERMQPIPEALAEIRTALKAIH